MTSVGFIGLGTMGGLMARNIVKKGNALTVFDVDPKAVATRVADGTRAAASPRDVAPAMRETPAGVQARLKAKG